MSGAKLTQEEVDALVSIARDRAASGPVVEARDFRAPRRLSVEQLASMAQAVAKALPDASRHLGGWLRGDARIQVQALVETTLDLACEPLKEPWCVWQLDCGGETGLLVWDASAAVLAAECALGGTPAPDTAARGLSTAETRVLEHALGPAVAAVAKSLGSDVKSMRQVADLTALAKLREGCGDSPRLAVQLALDQESGPSSLRLLLARTKAPETAPTAAGPAKAKTALPGALMPVQVEIGAHLGDVDVPLADLLALEVGDVIPLALELDGIVDVHVEGARCMTARIGSHKGQLALRIAALGARAPLI